MNDSHAQSILEQLQTISRQIKALAQQLSPESPNYQRPLHAFNRFNWDSIGAIILHRDDYGPAILEWNGHQWTRRNGSGKFGNAIWFSRATGSGDDGTEYARLITFKDYAKPEPLDDSVASSLPASPSPIPAPPVSANGNGHKTKTLEMWEQEAQTSRDPLMFDTAIWHAIPFYRDAQTAQKFRETIFGSADNIDHPAAVYAGMARYAAERDASSRLPAAQAHNDAKIAALNAYNRLVREHANG